jgi:hypothetical protein
VRTVVNASPLSITFLLGGQLDAALAMQRWSAFIERLIATG